MKILVADDEEVTRGLLEEFVRRMGHQVVTACDGGEALACLESDEPPDLALLDWVMPVLDGHEVCRAIRSASREAASTYLILLTARARKADIVAGLRAGANDYVIKPFDTDELALRIEMGIKVSCMERKLRSRSREVEALTRQVEALERLVPICAGCRERRTDEAYWEEVAAHLAAGSASAPSCPSCLTAVHSA
jgi:DNA-binding response OmpR family regulator